MYPYIAGNLLELGGLAKLTLPSLLGVNHWLVIVPLAVFVAVMLDRPQEGVMTQSPSRRA